MHFQPSHMSHGARRNPTTSTKKASAESTRTTTGKAPKEKSAGGKAPKGKAPADKGVSKSPPTAQQQRRAAAVNFKIELKARAKARRQQQRAAKAAQLGVAPEHPLAEIPVSPVETTLLTAEEQAAWMQTGLPLPTDAELLSTADEGELLVDSATVEFTPEEGAEEAAPEESSGKGKYMLAAAGAALAAFFALR